ncbi:MAG: TauD/TfdA family dioxygenase [Sphingomonadales bacterium]|nr:TauD/TfdA family dioxygenase [Sphingomonadales bacterium]
MARLDITPLANRQGIRIAGVTLAACADAGLRAELNALFEQHGTLVFAGVEPTVAMHVALSEVFGPLKDHPSPAVPRVEGAPQGVIDMPRKVGEPGSIEVDGRELAAWLPWHFDHAYNNELNRAGVLRAIDIPPDGGRTGFVDGIALYEALSPGLRAAIEGKDILYRMNVIMENFRFGRPERYRVVAESLHAGAVMDAARDTPRAIHPAVWTRATGEKVLHISPWMAEGIAGMENEEGDALLDAVCREIHAHAERLSYFHEWSLTDMLIWDNWRVLHAVSGHDPRHFRRMQRTTIKGDYGLGRFEGDGTGSKVLEMTF